jgi:hypothetical protein
MDDRLLDGRIDGADAALMPPCRLGLGDCVLTCLEVPMIVRKRPPVHRLGLSSSSRSPSDVLLDAKDMAVVGRSSGVMSGEQSCSSISDLLYAALCGVEGASKVINGPERVDWVWSARTMMNRRLGAGFEGEEFGAFPCSRR